MYAVRLSRSMSAMHPALMTMIADERAEALRRSARGRVLRSPRLLGWFRRDARRGAARIVHA